MTRSTARGPDLPVAGAVREPILALRDVTVRFADGGVAVRGVSLDIAAGETVGLVGGSGAGKTMLALAVLRLLPAGARVAGGVFWKGRDLLRLDERALRSVRGAEIALVPQDPMTALNPLQRVDRQVAEALLTHDPLLPRARAFAHAERLLGDMGVPAARLRSAGYPFEWSGGMRQRALIAMAVANRPALLIADEPTTALDATTQAAVLDLLRTIQRETGAALLLITHDLAVIARMASRVAVMHDGRIVESACVGCIRDHPRSAYTAELVAAARPPAARARARPAQTPPVLRVEHVGVRYRTRRGWRGGGWLDAVNDVSFELAAGETLAIAGESGSGKSSLARTLVRLERPHAGRVLLDGVDLARLHGRALRAARAGIQLVFQEHHASLNPRRTVADSIAEPLLVHGRADRQGAAARARRLLEQVGLSAALARRRPHELSGGQRQRVALARALALGPRVLVLDEPVTSLDAIARAALLRLLNELQRATGVACVLVAHDLGLVQSSAHRVAIMHAGRIVEAGDTATIFGNPSHEQTRRLLAARMTTDPPRTPGGGEAA